MRVLIAGLLALTLLFRRPKRRRPAEPRAPDGPPPGGEARAPPRDGWRWGYERVDAGGRTLLYLAGVAPGGRRAWFVRLHRRHSVWSRCHN